MYQGTGEPKKIFKVQSQVHMNQKKFQSSESSSHVTNQSIVQVQSPVQV